MAHGICVCVFVASTVVVVVFSSCISVAVLHSQTPVKLRYLLCDLPRWSDREAVFSIGWCISLPLFSSPFCLILSHPLLQYFVFLTLSFPCSVLSFLLTSLSLCFLLPCFVLSSLSSLTLSSLFPSFFRLSSSLLPSLLSLTLFLSPFSLPLRFPLSFLFSFFLAFCPCFPPPPPPPPRPSRHELQGGCLVHLAAGFSGIPTLGYGSDHQAVPLPVCKR